MKTTIERSVTSAPQKIVEDIASMVACIAVMLVFAAVVDGIIRWLLS